MIWIVVSLLLATLGVIVLIYTWDAMTDLFEHGRNPKKLVNRFSVRPERIGRPAYRLTLELPIVTLGRESRCRW